MAYRCRFYSAEHDTKNQLLLVDHFRKCEQVWACRGNDKHDQILPMRWVGSQARASEHRWSWRPELFRPPHAIYFILDYISNKYDQLTTISPICLIISSSGRSDFSSLTTLLAWSHNFCWFDMLMFKGGGSWWVVVGLGRRKATFCHLQILHSFEAELLRIWSERHLKAFSSRTGVLSFGCNWLVVPDRMHTANAIAMHS